MASPGHNGWTTGHMGAMAYQITAITSPLFATQLVRALTSKIHQHSVLLALLWEDSPVTGDSTKKGPTTREKFPWHDIIMCDVFREFTLRFLFYYKTSGDKNNQPRSNFEFKIFGEIMASPHFRTPISECSIAFIISIVVISTNQVVMTK